MGSNSSFSRPSSSEFVFTSAAGDVTSYTPRSDNQPTSSRPGDDDDGDDDDDDVDDRFYKALFSALEQTHCAFAAGDSK